MFAMKNIVLHRLLTVGLFTVSAHAGDLHERGSGVVYGAELSSEPPLLIGPGPILQRDLPLVMPGGPEPLAPSAGPVVEGVNFDDNGFNTGGHFFVPPDPMGAVGHGQLVSIVNGSIGWHTEQVPRKTTRDSVLDQGGRRGQSLSS